MTGTWLNIGCGKQHLSGFVNMDIEHPYDVKLDATQGLPYRDQTVDGVYSEHFFEHLTQTEGLAFLRECRRVLKPNGRIRVAMPDLDEEVRRYVSSDWRGDGDMFKLGFEWVANRCEMLNIGMREWGHKYLYNEEELIRVARTAGFEPTQRYANGKSETPEFVGRETRAGSYLIMEFMVSNKAVAASPLVSVVIPAYRVTWFQQAFSSALSQTHQNIELVVCDDSPNGDIEEIVQAAAISDSRVTYIRNVPALGSANNLLKCTSLAKGEFIKTVNDDDLLEPTCIEKMLSVFREHPTVNLVTSYRKLIDASGNRLPDMPATRRLTLSDFEFEGISCTGALLATRLNFIGEPTSVMYRKVDLEWVAPNYLTFAGRLALGAGDVCMWLHLLGRGNAFYISEALSSFRWHAGQEQHQQSSQAEAGKTWAHLITHGQRLGLFGTGNGASIKGREKSTDPWQTFYFN